MKLKEVFLKFKKMINSFSAPSEPELTAQQKDFVDRNIVVMQNSNVSPDSIVGDNTYIGLNSNITKATIGNYCSIANNVTIGSGEHLLDSISTSALFYHEAKTYEILTKNKCTIGHDVWIGVDAIIRRGVTIGNGAVIGANSFVNKDVPDFAIVVGSPAKIVRYRFNEAQINKLNESKWWLLPLNEAKSKVRELELGIRN